ncbi:MAG: bifunctional 4-hydroxy-2-oxoglutarate aldolase/2-dehydro-3-deoxy-phosphogluconate aldolase, partial [Cyclobacteriaceae bacterium]
TGGVEPEPNSITRWFNAGASVVGMGSKLVSKTVMEHGKFQELERNTAVLLEIISAFKKS